MSQEDLLTEAQKAEEYYRNNATDFYQVNLIHKLIEEVKRLRASSQTRNTTYQMRTPEEIIKSLKFVATSTDQHEFARHSEALEYLVAREADRATHHSKLQDIVTQQSRDLEKAYACLHYGDVEAAKAVLDKYRPPL